MRLGGIVCQILLIGVARGSPGDRLKEYSGCLADCSLIYGCEEFNVFERIAQAQEAQRKAGGVEKREDGEEAGDEVYFTREDFTGKYDLSNIFRYLFRWDCTSDCKYKCQQLITDKLEEMDVGMVQFYGKWPFIRVFGIQELFSVIFSMGNWYVNYVNLFKVLKQYHKSRKLNTDLKIMYRQYLILLWVSLAGWTFSSLFHMRDNAITETLDYVGAGCIILANFNAISMRFFSLYTRENTSYRIIFQTVIGIILALHLIHMKLEWDYQYNVRFNLIFGITAMVFWILHSLNTARIYLQNSHIYNNSIQLLPFETKLLSKLNYIWMSKSKHIPLLPVYFNMWLIIGMSFELLDFAPIWRLVDAHSIWHLFTIFPTILWFDWNIWDLEFTKVSQDITKYS